MESDKTIKIISAFYEFLVDHGNLPASVIKTPPSEGWPEEYRPAFRKLGKSEEVVDLLSHLPYIDTDGPELHEWEIIHETKSIDYTSRLNQRRLNGEIEKKRYIFEPSGIEIPSYVFSLTNGQLYGSWLLLDTQTGKLSRTTCVAFAKIFQVPSQNTQFLVREREKSWRNTARNGDFFQPIRSKNSFLSFKRVCKTHQRLQYELFRGIRKEREAIHCHKGAFELARF